MTFNRAIGIRRVTYRVETPYLRQILAALILLAICFFAVGVVVLVTRAQNPNCVELKKRLDDANRGYQTILAQSMWLNDTRSPLEIPIVATCVLTERIQPFEWIVLE